MFLSGRSGLRHHSVFLRSDYYLENFDESTDNPDQRIQEDVGALVSFTLSLLIGSECVPTRHGNSKKADPDSYWDNVNEHFLELA